MTYRILVVDDVRILKFPFEAEVVHVDNADDGQVQMIYHGPWDEVWLDHDLGMSSMNGYEMISEIVDAIEDEGLDLPVERFYVHSQNPVGAENIVRTLQRHWPYTRRIDVTPFMDWENTNNKARQTIKTWALWDYSPDWQLEST